MRGLTSAAMSLLDQHCWPGNIRELRNVIERAMLLLQRDWIGTEDLSGLVRAGTRVLFRLPADGLNLDDVQRQLLVQALERAGGNQTQAGHLLGLNRDQVRYQLKKFHLPLLRPAAAIQ